MSDDTPAPDARAVEAIRAQADTMKARADALRSELGAPDLLEMMWSTPSPSDDMDRLIDRLYEAAPESDVLASSACVQRDDAIRAGADPDDARFTDVGDGWLMLRREAT